MSPKTIGNKHRGEYRIFILILFLLLIPVFMATDCSTDTTHNEGPVPFEALRVNYPSGSEKENIHSCDFNYSEIEYDSTYNDSNPGNVEFIFTRENEFAQYITCTDSTQINFEDHFVAAGISDLLQCVYVNHHELLLKNDSLRYDVDLYLGNCRAVWRTPYIIKISNEYREYPFSFDVHY